MNKRDFIIKQIAKTNKKNFENYVVTRIYHMLNRSDVKFMTQQYVNRNEGHALTDMYFPQLALHIEIDEPFHKKQIESDLNRETEIIQATNHEVRRISITPDIESIDHQIDLVVNELRKRIITREQNANWEPWDIEKEFNPQYHIEKGYLAVNENPAFRKIIDACNCLGQDYKAVQQGWFKSKVYPNHYLWFPKFYDNEEWDNRISNDGKTIFEKCKNPDNYKKWFEGAINNPVKRITFPRSFDNLGFKLYKFAGIFETDFENSSPENGMIYKLKQHKLELKKTEPELAKENIRL
ncbi:AbaSI family restriction endonuclease [Namhaeicola litoreus]|uniref:AbaSI family restriction endonuclease n=1 Tax=Namhaeicola litoreus TaxID=1052145 RepID=A0ABW3Y0D3_9FLAO